MAPATAFLRTSTLGAVRIIALGVTVLALVAGVTYAVVALGRGTVITFGPFSRLASELPSALVVVNAAAVVLWCTTIAAMAWILASLARAASRGIRFERPLSRSAWALAIVLALGATVVQFVTNLSTWSLLHYPDDADPATVDLSTLPIEWAHPSMTLVPSWPLLGIAVVLGVLAHIIAAGQRLQRDTEGLV